MEHNEILSKITILLLDVTPQCTVEEFRGQTIKCYHLLSVQFDETEGSRCWVLSLEANFKKSGNELMPVLREAFKIAKKEKVWNFSRGNFHTFHFMPRIALFLASLSREYLSNDFLSRRYYEMPDCPQCNIRNIPSYPRQQKIRENWSECIIYLDVVPVVAYLGVWCTRDYNLFQLRKWKDKSRILNVLKICIYHCIYWI